MNIDFSNYQNEIKKRINDLRKCLSNHFGLVDFLLTSLSEENIDLNVIHGDPKLSNFLFDLKSNKVVSLIDLDTVTSGQFLTDLAYSGNKPKPKPPINILSKENPSYKAVILVQSSQSPKKTLP